MHDVTVKKFYVIFNICWEDVYRFLTKKQENTKFGRTLFKWREKNNVSMWKYGFWGIWKNNLWNKFLSKWHVIARN